MTQHETMTAGSVKGDLDRSGITGLISAVERGIHTMPDGFTANHAKLNEIVAESTDRFGRFEGWRAEKAATETMTKMGQMIYGGNASAVIVEHIQPGLTKIIDDMRNDFALAGRFVNYTGSPGDLLAEPEPVRMAYTRLLDSHGRYHGLRSSWEAIRVRALHEPIDPLGLNSPLAEVANMPDIIENWKLAHAGRAPWPWTGTAHHIRMHWLLSNGAVIWAPTGQQQNDTWHKYNPGVRIH